MAWEQRRGRRYYYRPRKTGGRVVREYVGAGPIGELAAVMDAEDRAERAATRTADRAERDRFAGVIRATESLCAAAETAMVDALAAAGYCRHKRGEWRRTRGA